MPWAIRFLLFWLSLVPFVSRWFAIALYVGVVALWLIPDRRIVRAFEDELRG